MKIRCEYEPRSGGVLRGDLVDAEYMQALDLYNSGLDRENLPQNAVTDAMMKSGEMLEHAIANQKYISDDYCGTPSAVGTYHGPQGVEYDKYDGGWVDFYEEDLEIPLDSWVQVDLSGTVMLNEIHVMYFQILIAGEVVAESSGYPHSLGTLFMSGAGPASGATTITIRWRHIPPDSGDSLTSGFSWFGGATVAITVRSR